MFHCVIVCVKLKHYCYNVLVLLLCYGFFVSAKELIHVLTLLNVLRVHCFKPVVFSMECLKELRCFCGSKNGCRGNVLTVLLFLRQQKGRNLKAPLGEVERPNGSIATANGKICF